MADTRQPPEPLAGRVPVSWMQWEIGEAREIMERLEADMELSGQRSGRLSHNNYHRDRGPRIYHAEK